MRLLACGAKAILLTLPWAGALGVRLSARGREPRPEAAVEVTGELPDDDGLQILPNSKGRLRGGGAAAPPAGATATLRAWRACKAWAKDTAHQVDSIASLHGNFLFVDNVKAGSTSVRFMFATVLNRSWVRTDLPYDAEPKKGGCCGRFSSMSFPPERLASLFRFGIVRDPVDKFESGVRQAWVQNKGLANLTADEVLDRQLELWQGLRKPGQKCQGHWLNEHLQPNSWRLSTYTSDDKMLDLDFIAKIETFDEDWPAVVSAMGNISPEEQDSLSAIGHQNAREHDPRSKLSPAGIRRMCQSETYSREWECFGYPRPAECD